MNSKVVIAWLYPILMMGIIFFLSSRERVTISPVFSINFVIFKSLHMIEYATLYFLLFRAYYITNKKHPEFIKPFVIAVLYAATDEFHQTFVPTREGTVRDVLIDTAGIAIMYTLIKQRIRIIGKYL